MEHQLVQWPQGRRAAVSLSYDDGLPLHPQVVGPLLEKYGFRGTFYTPLNSDLMQSPLPWRKLAARGHELGNHTVFHPCRNTGGRYSSWLDEELDLTYYDEERWVDEITTANSALALVDGKNERTFGNTCFDNLIGPEHAPIKIESLAAPHFIAARGENTDRPVDLTNLNLYNLGTVWADQRSFGDLAPDLEQAIETGGWVIYTFHGVGHGTHNHFIAESEHNRLLAFLQANQSRIWTAPVIEVARHLKKIRK
jgi:hypothetical protein